MSTIATRLSAETVEPVQLRVAPALDHRNRLTTTFRLLLAIPHLVLVGGPVAGALSWAWRDDSVRHANWMADGGALGAVAALAAVIGWFAIVFTGREAEGLWKLAAFYLRWRVRAIAYMALLSDEYPPFGDGAYPVSLVLMRPALPRDRLGVAFRLILAIPQLMAIWAISLAWAMTTAIAWLSILITGRYPVALYDFAVGALRWNLRVEAYLLLLSDRYPPFSLT